MKTITKIQGRDLRPWGTIETDEKGNQTAKDFYFRIVGYHKADRDVTTDFYGNVVAHGNVLASLIPSPDEQNRQR